MDFQEKVLASMFDDIDLALAETTLAGQGLEPEYSDANVAVLNQAADRLCIRAAELKIADAPRAERRAIKEQIDALVNARAFLYRIRPSQPGDVTATFG